VVARKQSDQRATAAVLFVDRGEGGRLPAHIPPDLLAAFANRITT